MSKKELSYEDVDLSVDDYTYLDECCNTINFDFTHGYGGQKFINERTRLLNYLVFIKIRENHNYYKDIIDKNLEDLRRERRFHDRYYVFWRDFLDNDKFERLYENSEQLNEMRSSSPIPGGSIIGQELRVKVYKYLDSKYDQK